jgi:enoyl-CoA hydratase/carnithine racemase
MSDLVELDRTREDRLVITLNRPERRNALDRAMIDALHDVCAELEERPRLAILTGQEGVFAGGADIAELRDRGVAEALEGISAPADLMSAAHRLCDRLAAQAPLALRLTKLAIDAPDAAHPAVEMLAQAVLFTDQDKQDRMTAFLDRGRKRS